MTRIVLSVTANLSPFLNVVRYAEKNRPELLETAAKRLLKYQRERFLRLSRGGGEWSPLKSETIKRKKRRGVSKNPSLILREKGELLAAMGMKISNNRYLVGFVQNRSHWRAKGTTFLALVHHFGKGRVSQRRVIGIADPHIKKRMVEDVKMKFRRVIAAQRRKKGSK